jgi:hypothetical protein
MKVNKWIIYIISLEEILRKIMFGKKYCIDSQKTLNA